MFGAKREALRIDPGVLVENGQVSKAIVSYPIAPGAPQPNPLEDGVKAGTIEIEMNRRDIGGADPRRRRRDSGVLVAGGCWDGGGRK